MTVFRFAKPHPRNKVTEVVDRWRVEVEREKVVTEAERQEFRAARLVSDRARVEEKQLALQRHRLLVEEAGVVLEAALARNGFTDRFRVSIRGVR